MEKREKVKNFGFVGGPPIVRGGGACQPWVEGLRKEEKGGVIR